MSDFLSEAWQGLPALPFAEDLNPAWLHTNAELLAQSPRRGFPVPRFYTASNTLELGLSTGSVKHADEAFSGLHELVDDTRYDLTKKPFIAAQRTVAYEVLFRQRIGQDVTPEEGITQAYKDLSTLMMEIIDLDVLEGPQQDREVWGSLGELLVDGALLRDKDVDKIPFPASVREERCMDGSQSGHDGYICQLVPNQSPKKVPISTAMQLKDKDTRHSLHLNPKHYTGTHPDINLIAVTPVLSQAIHTRPRIEETIRNTTSDVKVAQAIFIAKMMHAEAHGVTLEAPQHAILKAVTKQMLKLSIDVSANKRKNSIRTAQERRPLGQSLAEKLRVAGFSSDSER